MNRTALAIFMTFSAASAFSQTGIATDADRKMARDLSRSIVYLKTLTVQCNMPRSEKDTLALFAKVAISNAFGQVRTDKASVDAGAREGKMLATADMTKRPRSVVCDNARKTIQQIGDKLLAEGGAQR